MCDKSCFTANHLIAANTCFAKDFAISASLSAMPHLQATADIGLFSKGGLRRLTTSPVERWHLLKARRYYACFGQLGLKNFGHAQGIFWETLSTMLQLKNLNRRDDYMFLLYPMGSDSSKNNFHKPKFRSRLWFGPQ